MHPQGCAEPSVGCAKGVVAQERSLATAITCRNHFEQMLAWEFEYPEVNSVHHLMVLCYHLQHPSLYSPDGLGRAIHILAEFLDVRFGPEEVHRRDG